MAAGIHDARPAPPLIYYFPLSRRVTMSILTAVRGTSVSAVCALVLGGVTLSRAEDVPQFATAGYARGMRTQEMMNKVDTDGDGMVSRKEWLAFHEKVFAMLDKDHKGS